MADLVGLVIQGILNRLSIPASHHCLVDQEDLVVREVQSLDHPLALGSLVDLVSHRCLVFLDSPENLVSLEFLAILLDLMDQEIQYLANPSHLLVPGGLVNQIDRADLGHL